MNQPATTGNAPTQRAPLGDIDAFAECCRYQRWFVDRGWISKQLATDRMQWLAILWALPDEYGVDAIQTIMADAFAPRGRDALAR